MKTQTSVFVLFCFIICPPLHFKGSDETPDVSSLSQMRIFQFAHRPFSLSPDYC